MKQFAVTGFVHGVWCTITVTTIYECVAMRAAQKGMTEITNIEEV